MVRFKFEFFDPAWITDGDIIVMIGKKKTGKTTILNHIMRSKRHIPDGCVFSGTEESNENMKNHIPESFIFEEWDRAVAYEMVMRARRINRERKRKKLPKKYTFFIVDDLNCDDSFTKDPVLKRIFMNGRHYGIFFIFTMQYSLGVAPTLRSNIDWVFICREIIPANRKRLHEHYCGQIGTLAEFNAVMDQVTQDYRCLVIKNTGISNRIEDNFFWWKATVYEDDWRMGCKAFWAAHEENYNEHWQSDEEKQYKKKLVDNPDFLEDPDDPSGVGGGRSLRNGNFNKRRRVEIRMLPK